VPWRRKILVAKVLTFKIFRTKDLGADREGRMPERGLGALLCWEDLKSATTKVDFLEPRINLPLLLCGKRQNEVNGKRKGRRAAGHFRCCLWELWVVCSTNRAIRSTVVLYIARSYYCWQARCGLGFGALEEIAAVVAAGGCPWVIAPLRGAQ
jgi:hypothetical protein